MQLRVYHQASFAINLSRFQVGCQVIATGHKGVQENSRQHKIYEVNVAIRAVEERDNKVKEDQDTVQQEEYFKEVRRKKF